MNLVQPTLLACSPEKLQIPILCSAVGLALHGLSHQDRGFILFLDLVPLKTLHGVFSHEIKVVLCLTCDKAGAFFSERQAGKISRRQAGKG